MGAVPEGKGGEQPDFSPDDLAASDRAWSVIRRAEERAKVVTLSMFKRLGVDPEKGLNAVK
jgi:hypothetical protein